VLKVLLRLLGRLGLSLGTAREEGGSKRRRAVVAAAVAALVAVSGGALALGGSPMLKAPLALTSPVIDGTVSPANEWSDAGKLQAPFPGHPATLYLKHDASYLYVLLAVQDEPPPSGILCCSATLFFDDNHDGIREPGEDAIAFGPADQSSDQFFRSDAMAEYVDDQLDGGTDDTLAAGSYDASTHTVVLEARKPLCSSDSAHDFCLKAGLLAGFTLDYSTSAQNATFDYPATPDDFAHFGDLLISATPLLADIEVHVNADKKSAGAGENVTYTMNVTNNGPDSATTPILGGAYKLSGVTVNLPQMCPCTLRILAPGSRGTFRQTVAITSVAAGGGTISLEAAAAAAETDPVPGNNDDDVTVTVTGAPVAGEAVTASTSGGQVSVKPTATKAFVPLKHGKSIAIGSEVEASRGKVQVISATPTRKLQTVTASAGRFRVLQQKSAPNRRRERGSSRRVSEREARDDGEPPSAPVPTASEPPRTATRSRIPMSPWPLPPRSPEPSSRTSTSSAERR
jgi:hypothetical protein